MKKIPIILLVFLMFLLFSTSVLAKEGSEINFDYLANGSTINDTGIEGFILGGNFYFDNEKFGLEYGPLTYEGGANGHRFNMVSGYGISENVFFTFSFYYNSIEEISFSGLLFGLEGSKNLGDRFSINGYLSTTLILDGNTTVDGISGYGDTSVFLYGLRLNYAITENLNASMRYSVDNMKYTEDDGWYMEMENTFICLGLLAKF